jgi:hypothetical protein
VALTPPTCKAAATRIAGRVALVDVQHSHIRRWVAQMHSGGAPRAVLR